MKVSKLYLMLFCIIFIFFTYCSQNSDDKKLKDIFTPNSYWENSNLDVIIFDSLNCKIGKFSKSVVALKGNFEYEFNSDSLFLYLNKQKYATFKLKSISIDSVELISNIKQPLLFSKFKFYNKKRIDRYKYFQSKDSLCTFQIQKAAKDIINNIYIFSYLNKSIYFRNEKEFIQLLSQNGIVYKKNFYSCSPPNNRNCYQECMNDFLINRYGYKFFDSLLRVSDSLMIKNNPSKYFSNSVCDKRSSIFNKSWITFEDYLNTTLPLKDFEEITIIDEEKIVTKYHPFMDIDFKVDTLGRTSDFRLNNYYSKDKFNDKFKKQMFEEAVNYIRFQQWQPGEILGKKVNTENNLRIQFTSESKFVKF